MLYRDIFKQSIQISWRNKFLWFFGLFSVFILGESKIFFYGFVNNPYQDISSFFEKIKQTAIFNGHFFENLGMLFRNETLSIFIVVLISLLSLVVLVFLVWLAVISQSSLISSSAEIILGKKDLSIKKAVIKNIKNFWPIFGFNFFVKIFIYLSVLLVSLPVAFSFFSSEYSANLIFIILFIIFIPIAIIFSFIAKYGSCYVVIKNNNFLDSIKKGWNLFIKNWIISIEMAFILFFIDFLVSIGIMMLVLVLSIPFMLLIILFAKTVGTIGFFMVLFLGITTLLFFSLIIGSFFAVFQIASWTNLFLKLEGKGFESKIVRVINNFKK